MGHPSKFQRVSRLGLVTAATSLNGGQPNFTRCLAVSLAGTLHIHFWGLLFPEILPGAKFTLRPSLALSYVGRVTARHSSSGRQQTDRQTTVRLHRANRFINARPITIVCALGQNPSVIVNCQVLHFQSTHLCCMSVCSVGECGLNALTRQAGFLWPPCVADADIIFLPCGFCLSSIFLFFIPRLISAVGD